MILSITIKVHFCVTFWGNLVCFEESQYITCFYQSKNNKEMKIFLFGKSPAPYYFQKVEKAFFEG